MGIDFGVYGAADFNNQILRPPPHPPFKGHPPPAVTPKYEENNRYIVMGVDFGVIGAGDFDNDIRFHVRQPVRRLRVTRRRRQTKIQKR